MHVDGLDVDFFYSVFAMWDILWFLPQLWSNLGGIDGDFLSPILMPLTDFPQHFGLDCTGTIGDPKKWAIFKSINCLTI